MQIKIVNFIPFYEKKKDSIKELHFFYLVIHLSNKIIKDTPH